MTVDAANLNMINWASALRGNRRKGAALLKAMLADPVQRAAVCADPDALSLIFGYGPDDPLAEAARGVPASAVVCYANSRYGKGYADFGELADDMGSLADAIAGDAALAALLARTDAAADALAERASVGSLLSGSPTLLDSLSEVAKRGLLSDAFLSGATDDGLSSMISADWAADVVSSPAMADKATSGTVQGNRLLDALFALDAMTDVLATSAYIEAGSRSAAFLNRMCKSVAASAAWLRASGEVSSFAGQIKETLDAAPSDLFSEKFTSYWDTPKQGLSSLNISDNAIAKIGDDGEIAFVNPTSASLSDGTWKNYVARSGVIDIVNLLNYTVGTNNSKLGLAAMSAQSKELMAYDTAVASPVGLRAVAPGGVAFFCSDSLPSLGKPSASFHNSQKIGYARYVAV